MAWVLPLIVLGWPLAEIAALIAIAGWIGWPAALAGVVLSSIVGLGLLRLQGLSVARQVQADLDRGRMPVAGLFDGACLAVAGLLFLLPGYVSGAIALLLLPPPSRHLLRLALASRFQPIDPGVAAGGGAGPGATVIDGDWRVVDDPGGSREPARNPAVEIQAIAPPASTPGSAGDKDRPAR